MTTTSIKKLPFTWIVLPLGLSIMILLIVLKIQLPLFVTTFEKSRELFTLFQDRERSEKLPQEIENVRINIQKLYNFSATTDSVRKNSTPLIDNIYSLASMSKFSLLKVEAGSPLQIENYHETTITINGKGNYESIGKFTEEVENCSQSTRIRQILMSGDDRQSIESTMEIVITGE